MEAKILDYIYDENKELIGVNLDQIGELKISHWEEKVIGSFARVEFKIPAKDGVFTKFIPERLRLYKNGEIQSNPFQPKKDLYQQKKKRCQIFLVYPRQKKRQKKRSQCFF